ncbi:MAG: F1F0 ATPase subunit 2 [Paraglaciecola sp.]|jgi:F1F0 ATPase subunit 2
MTNLIQLSITFLPTLMFGMVIGMAFFCILWFTVRRGLISLYPARWFLGGLLLRMIIALGGFYFIANGDWFTLVICLLGFVISRELVRRIVAFRRFSNPNLLNSEQNNAP